MRPLVLASALLAGLGLSMVALSPALAQTSAPAESAPLPIRQGLSMQEPDLQEDAALQAAVASDSRPVGDRARDVHRHPYESLTFWGLTPGMTVVEIEPGAKGWWRQILEPYAIATGGTYVPVNRPLEGMGVEDGQADLVLVARAFHNWARSDRTEPYLAAFYRALKPGGILAVEQHRGVEGLNAAETAAAGYVSESYVIRAARDAGFELDARSDPEISQTGGAPVRGAALTLTAKAFMPVCLMWRRQG